MDASLSQKFTNGEPATMKRTSLILIAVFAMVMLPAAFGQGTPSQDPNMPSATPSQQTPSSQQPSQTSPSTSDPASSGASSDAQRSFVGSIAKTGGKFVLHTGGTDYKLDDQSQAKKFEGKDVKVTGQLDQASNTIKVQSIEPTSSM
jgi:ABC-type transport system substrate-binding protein